MKRIGVSLLLLAATASAAFLPSEPVFAQQKGKDKGKAKIEPKPQFATPPETMKVAKGFQVELLYSVPKPNEGSWVNLCHDPKGRLIVSDQYGALYRITPPPIGQKADIKPEKIPAQIGMAQGLLWAFDALYVVVNGQNSGLYRVTSSKNDDTLDKVELLRAFEGGGGEHGPHAVLLHPDKKRLTIICGNQTKLTKYDTTRVPPVWGEDHLLPRLPDGNGFMKGVMGPGGAIYNVTPDGKTWELFSVGYRNQYDAGYNKSGDLFTYDADMEWDFNTPWYRPTRVCLATSGSEFGWRNGAGKYPPFYADNLPGICDIGPGSPTGVCFGYGAKFPTKYQNAFFICDWSYGKMYAVHLDASGSGYQGTAEEFVAGSPLPLTDVIINPIDNAMYFTIGGRRTQSGLYRVTYTGTEPGEPKLTAAEEERRQQAEISRNDRRLLEDRFHTANAMRELPFDLLGSPDRFQRFAARVALEHQPVEKWRDKALAETKTQASLEALLALVRVSAPDPLHAKPGSAKPDPALRDKVLESLARHKFADLSFEQRTHLVRIYQILFNRFGPPEGDAVAKRLDAVFPSGNRYVDGMLLETLVYLQHPDAAKKAIKLLAEAPTQEEQLEYVRSLRMLKTGWTPELRKEYFGWFVKAATYKGGNSFQGFLRLIKTDAVATLTDQEKVALQPILDAKPNAGEFVAAPRPFVKRHSLDDLAPVVEAGLKAGKRDFDRGRKLFGAANCFACHRFDNEGGSAGPDLTGAAGRFNQKDLLESILDPNKEISDQYAAVEIDLIDGRKVIGRIVNLNGDGFTVNTDMLNPNGNTNVNRNQIDRMKPSKVSMMPAGTLDTLTDDEVLDLMAYLLSRGDRNAAVFKK